jgi:signal transduction histidine kinase
MSLRASTPDLTPLLSIRVSDESDIVTARQRARQIASVLGFTGQEQVGIATAVSEIARNAFQYAGGGRVDFSITLRAQPQRLTIQVSDKGPGIQDVNAIFEGRYQSSTGMGLGLMGTRRLMDSLSVESGNGKGTVVRFEKFLPAQRRIGLHELTTLTSGLHQARPERTHDELRRQNTELLDALQALRNRELELEQRQNELARLNLELEETNRGVVALYAELDENASALRRADDLKSHFLSHVSHVFRTPLNSILALTHLLLRRADGDLTEEQEKQVGYIRRSAQELIEMVNDLLDLAKVEAGKTEVHASWIEIGALFGALRAIMRPLATNEAVALVFEESTENLRLHSDEGKVSQILRNLISNALKFTDHGEVRVAVRLSDDRRSVLLTVSDTGIGIAPEDQEKIFQEFTQVQNRLQKRVKGTGLGLPLSRKLATLMGGKLEVASVPGLGSTFTLTLPADVSKSGPSAPGPAGGLSILVIDDEESSRYLVRKMFQGTSYRIIEAEGGVEGAERARFERPALIFLDLAMPDRSGFETLDELKADPNTSDLPIAIHTSKRLSAEDYERLAGRHAVVLSKGLEGRTEALRRIRALLNDPSLFTVELDEAKPSTEVVP